MAREIVELLLRQHDIAWQLASYHLDTLDDDGEFLSRPARRGLHVAMLGDRFRGEWPDHEGYDLGPPSIAWLYWHIGFWWSMAIDHSFGDARLAQEAITCPANAKDARAWLQSLHAEWTARLSALDDDEVRSTTRTRFPFTDRPFHDVAAWVNIELAKNASEIGYARFLHGARDGA
jgi:hypothetical protein